MRLWQGFATAGLIIALTNTAWLYARHHQPDSLSPEDRLEIQQLYAYYARDVDSGSRRNASWMYTEDGVWDVEGMRVEGKEDLEEWYASVPPGVSKNGIRHFSTNLILVPSDEGVRGSAYMMGWSARQRAGPSRSPCSANTRTC